METDLLVIAKKHELEGFQKNEDMLSRISALDVPLNDVCSMRRPKTHDYDNRRDLIRIFNAIAKEIYGNQDECPVVEEFGSFLMDMFDAKSDLDLSINFSDRNFESRRDAKIKTLRKFAKKFYTLQKRGQVRNVQPILSARVPVLKVTDLATAIECDFSVGNLDGIAKSQIILMISAIDERFQKLSFLMKAWAKAHDINSSKDGTLNSLSLILLVAFHLQNRHAPILPPFSEILKDGTDMVAVKKTVSSFLDYGRKNKESLAELFVSLLVMLESVETLWPKGLCASTYEGSWIYKPWKSKKGEKIGFISIEDFTDRSSNTARAVKSGEIDKIYSCIRRSLNQIRSYVDGKIDAVKLTNRLFGPNPLNGNKGMTNINQHTLQKLVLDNPTQRKRKNLTEGGSKQGRRVLKTPNESSLRPASSQKRVANVVKPREFLGATESHPLSHSNVFSQNSVGIRPPERPVESWRYSDSYVPSSVPYSHHQPYFPSTEYRAPLGYDRSHHSPHPLPLSSPPFAGGYQYHAPDYRNFSAPLAYSRPLNVQHIRPNHYQYDPRPNHYQNDPRPNHYQNDPRPNHYQNDLRSNYYRNDSRPNHYQNDTRPNHYLSDPRSNHYHNDHRPNHYHNDSRPNHYQSDSRSNHYQKDPRVADDPRHRGYL